MGGLEIASFQEADRAALAQIYLETRRAAFYWWQPEHFQLEDFDRDTVGEMIFVARLKGEPVGFLAIWTFDSFIHHLYVLPKAQARGVGSKLLNVGLRALSRPARLKCLVANSRAVEFYSKQGWLLEETLDDDPMGAYHVFSLR